MALASVLIVLAGVWIFIAIRRQQQREAAQIQAQRENDERRQHEQTAQQQPPNTPPQVPQPSPRPITNSARTVAFVALTVSSVRGSESAGTQTLIIPHGTTQAQILLKLKDDSYPHYRVALQKNLRLS